MVLKRILARDPQPDQRLRPHSGHRRMAHLNCPTVSKSLAVSGVSPLGQRDRRDSETVCTITTSYFLQLLSKKSQSNGMSGLRFSILVELYLYYFRAEGHSTHNKLNRFSRSNSEYPYSLAIARTS